MRQNHIRRQNSMRIGKLFYAPHHGGSLLTPFRGEERRHVSAGSVFGLQRPVIFLDDEIRQFGHESRIPGESVGTRQIGDESEMQVAMGGVSRNSGNEPMLCE